MKNHSAKIIEYADYNKDKILKCPNCSWKDKADNGEMETFDQLFHIECPKCEKMIIIVNYPVA